MAWIESHQAIGRHPKTKRLARLLDVSLPAAIGHLHLLWWWALDYAQDGELSKYHVMDVADGAGWEGDAEHFVNCLIESGFVEGETLVLHDWQDYGGKLIEKRKTDAERKRKVKGTPAEFQRTSNGTLTEVAGRSHNSTNSTEDNSRNSTEDATTQPTPTNNPFREIEIRMQVNSRKQFIAKDKDYTAAKQLLDNGVPLNFILDGIDEAFKRNSSISVFTYCAKVIKDLWAIELAKRKPSEPLSFHHEFQVTNTRAPDQAGPYVSSDLPPEVEEFRKYARTNST